MGVKITELKANKIRKEINFMIEDKVNTITVFNPIGIQRENLMELFEKKANDGVSEPVLLELYTYLLKNLTDIEIEEDDNVLDILSSPNNALVLVQHELNEILNEIQIEYWTLKHLELNQAYNAIIMQEAINKAENMEILTKDLLKEE